jgi:hypothetical protein
MFTENTPTWVVVLWPFVWLGGMAAFWAFLSWWADKTAPPAGDDW